MLLVSKSDTCQVCQTAPETLPHTFFTVAWSLYFGKKKTFKLLALRCQILPKYQNHKVKVDVSLDKCNNCSRYCIYNVKFKSQCKLIECSRPFSFFISLKKSDVSL